jgi:hypothetical protein
MALPAADRTAQSTSPSVASDGTAARQKSSASGVKDGVIAALGSCDDAPIAVGDRWLLLVAERPDGAASTPR